MRFTFKRIPTAVAMFLGAALIPPFLSLSLVWVTGCSSVPEHEPSGPIARYGTTPTIDGVFEDGEWDDAEIVRAGTRELFRLKHDGTNLYFAIRVGGGELCFNTDAGLRVLHWSGQLGSMEYTRSDALTQSLAKPFDYELWGLRHESRAVIQETLADYLARNGWTANLASMGDLSQSELAVSFDWLGVDIESDRLVEIPGTRVDGGLLLARDDPRLEEIKALSRAESERRYPVVNWPAERAPNDSVGMGRWSDTIRLDPADFGTLWVDLKRVDPSLRSPEDTAGAGG